MANRNFNVQIPNNIQNGIKKHTPKILIGLIVLAGLFSTTFTIGPEQVGIILRFGEYKRTVNPGLNFKIPFGVEEVYKIPVERQLKAEFGFRTTKAGINSEFSQENDESLMLTGDLNIANVEWVVQYRINDPYKYMFKVKNPDETLRFMSEASMRQIVGDRTVNEVLTVGRQEIASSVQTLLQKLCSDYETGIKIEQIVLQDVNPPDPVKPSFNGVNAAQQEKERMINEALSNFNKVVPKAKGQAQETIQSAEGYALDRVNRAKGDVAKFNSLYNEYVKAPEVTKQRIYLETMEVVLPKIGNKIITGDKNSNLLPLLQIQTKEQKGKGDSK